MRTWMWMATGLMAAAALAPAVSRAGEDPAANAAALYDLTMQATASVARGQSGKVSVVISPKSGAEVHKEAPVSLALTAPAGLVTLAKAKAGRDDLKMEGAKASFEVPFTAAAPGKGAIEADLSFYICTEKSCIRQVRKASLPVVVK